jgi:hypothetical protein
MVDDDHAEWFCDDGDLGADVSSADDTEGLSPDREAAGRLCRLTAAQVGGIVGERDWERDDLAKHELRDGSDAGEWCVENGHAGAGTTVGRTTWSVPM